MMSHHAQLLIGGKEWALALLPQADQIPGLDASVREYERMTIKDVRALIADAQLRPVTRAHRSFVLMCDSILHEAQNALLKLFEEPNAHTVFYLIIPREDMLLPTLRSRLNLLDQEASVDDGDVFLKFKQKSHAEQLSEIVERLEAKDDVWVTAILRGIGKHARATKNARLMEDVLYAESYMGAAGSSKKMLLEHLALSI